MLRIVLVIALGAVGCDSGGEGPSLLEAAPPPPGGFAGTWEVKGTTKDLTRGDTRAITGRVILTEREGRYIGHSELATQFPTEGGPVHAEVLGTASGAREGNVLSGDAETQLVTGTVPGVDPEFAFIPRTVGHRIQSTWTAHFRHDGTLVVELENRPAPGEEYPPTRTTLYGKRIEGIGEGS